MIPPVLLAVIGVGAMLAQEVLVCNVLGQVFRIRIDGQGPHCHFCQFFKHNGIMNRLLSIVSPGKRTVSRAKHCGSVHGIASGKLLDDYLSGVGLVCFLHLVLSKAEGHGDIIIEMIRLRGTDAGIVYHGM